jgi:hypothetical protein
MAKKYNIETRGGANKRSYMQTILPKPNPDLSSSRKRNSGEIQNIESKGPS